MFKLKSVRSKLMFLIVFVVVVPMTIVSVFAFGYAAKSLQESYFGQTNQAAINVVRLLDDTINDAEGVLNQIALEMPVTALAKDKILKVEALDKFASIQKSNKEYSAVYLATNSGEMFIQPDMKIPDGDNPKVRPWYTKAIEAKGNVIWTDPYVDEGTGGIVISVAKSLPGIGGAVVGIDIQMTGLSDLVKELKVADNGYPAVLSSKGVLLAHPDKENLNRDISEEDWVKEVLSNQTGTKEYLWEGKQKHLYYATIEKTGMKVIGTITYEEVDKKAEGILRIIMMVAFACLVIGLLFAYYFAMRIIKPIGQLVTLMNKAQHGDISVAAMINSKDELGKLGNGFNQMMENIRNMVVKVRDSASTVLEVSHVLGEASAEVSTAVEEVSTTIQEIARGATDQAREMTVGTEKTQNLNLEIQEIIRSVQKVQDIADNTAEANNKGEKAIEVLSTKSEQIEQSFSNVAGVVNRLGDKSSQISAIISTITSIATQTNLLALNAAIEAARAGEAGRGFAVVAEEIRKLAEQSSASAKEVSSLIGLIQSEVSQTVSIVDGFKGNISEHQVAVSNTQSGFANIRRLAGELYNEMEQVDELTKALDKDKNEVADVMQNISAVSEESAAASEEVAASTEEVTASVQEISTTAEQLNQMAIQLSEAIKIFKL